MRIKKILIIIVLIIFLFLFLIKVNNQKNKIINKTYISFTFDDGYKNHFDLAFPIFKKYNITATEYVIVGKIGEEFEGSKLMNWDDLKDLNNAGWDIESHTLTHPYLTRLNQEEIEKEFYISKKILEERGFEVSSVAIPYGKYNNEIRNIAKKYYKAVRVSSWGCNKIISLDALKSKWIKNDTTLEEMKEWINDAEKNKCWLIIMLHHVEKNKTKEYSVSVSDLENLIEYIKEKNLDIKNIKEVLNELK